MTADRLPPKYRKAWEFEGLRTSRMSERAEERWNQGYYTFNVDATLIWSKTLAGQEWWHRVHAAGDKHELPPLPRCYKFKITYKK